MATLYGNSQSSQAGATKPQGAPIAAPSAVAQNRKDLKTLVGEWAATLLPGNAPPPASMGPLAWVRTEKVPELLAILQKAGVK